MRQRDGDQPLPVRNDARDVQSQVIEDIVARRQVGIERYGTALQPHNGRDALRDAYEEALDLSMYLKQLILEADPAHAGVLEEVAAERARQNERWGEQNHPDGTGSQWLQRQSGLTRWECQQAAKVGTVTWRHILREEVAEAFAESDPEKLRAELVQVAAVCTQWVEAIDRRGQS